MAGCLISRDDYRECLLRSVGLGLGGGHLDTACTLTVDNLELDVTIFTPGGAPRVLDLVIRSAVLNAVTNGKDTVIELGAAASSVLEDTAGVALEGTLVSLDGDRDGSLGDGSLEGLGAVGGHILEARDRNFTLGRVILAALVEEFSALVRVVGLALERSFLGVLESQVHVTTTTTVVLS